VRDWLVDLALPRSDRAAVTQAVVMAIIWSVVIVWSLRWRREYRTFVVGLAVLTFAWFGARTVH
jgi:hypothetical protein